MIFEFEIPFSGAGISGIDTVPLRNSELGVQVGRMFDESRSGRAGLKGNGVRLSFSFKQHEFRRVSH